MKKPIHSRPRFRPAHAVAVGAFCAALVWTARVEAHGSYHDQVARLTAAIAGNPEDGLLWLQLAGEKSEHGDWQEALEDLARAEAFSEGDLPVDLVRGQCLLQADRPDDARVALDRFLERQPRHLQGRLLRARALLRIGQIDAALRDYREAFASPGRVQPDHFQEAADAFVSAGRIDDAIRLLERGIVMFGPIPSLHLRALDAEVSLGRFDAALARIGALEERAPRREPWMGRRAEVLERAGRSADAIAAWRDLVAHLEALPNLERGSHAMSRLAEDARSALRRLSPAPVAMTAPHLR